MNVFEDLIGELKDENLLEDTVIDVKKGESNSGNEFEADLDAITDQSVAFELADNSEIPASETSELVNEAVVDAPEIKKPADEREFFRKRAMEEVSSLQMV